MKHRIWDQTQESYSITKITTALQKQSLPKQHSDFPEYDSLGINLFWAIQLSTFEFLKNKRK